MQKKVLMMQLIRQEDTDWLEKKVSEIINILEIDSLLTVPVSLPFMKAGMALSEEEILKILKIVSKKQRR